MAKITVKNIAGKDVKEIELKDFVFNVPSNDTLLHQIYVAQTGNFRKAIAHTKDRSERSGSGIKPWRQKGTGRARAGSAQSPLWRKGGVTFGPTKDRNFTKDTNQKMRQKAVMIALSEKLRSGQIIVIDELKYPEKKTKLFAETIQALGITGKSIVFSLTGDERACIVMSRNIPKVENTPTEILNVMHLLNRQYLIITEAGVRNLEGRFAAWDKQETK
ncbi:MAG: 50S ribosomal protein L4 [Candidatus Moranbacteria bacterium CG_4_10_14_3_um_filter_45_9]|nr:MAG: 50S ribosomal protein L4 [Candidatus Moranbacteria bacterium CG2_30_45_14]PIX90151.1 MAG: 50S ribosomal protein L4 [Candidatus Moranbacteria bacterium CG_4_10_14_3_um_filter_45_9]PJA85918.1 MAG: 50S ribosomal protein L4 [Candidatus Moranbacteria bacterium CG_4_9_14_3_um_filter_45_14]